ncbi:MAG: murein L,D-transpeptidase YcbB/YkuD [Hyphomicrobiaceae bacterium]|jgi:murein L,D-transpeptidase YcbB/YkuD
MSFSMLSFDRDLYRLVALAAASLAIVLSLALPAAAEPGDVEIGIQHVIAATVCDKLSSTLAVSVCRDLRTAYTSRVFRPVWVGNDDATARLEALARALQDGRRHALPGDSEWVAGLLESASELSGVASPDVVPGVLAAIDVAASQAFLRAARERARGRLDPAVADPQWFIPRPAYNAVAALEEAAISGDVGGVLDRQVPTSHGYSILLEALEASQREGDDTFDPIPAGGTLRSGSHNRRVVWLRARLRVEAAAGEASLFDENLEAAVKTFQQAHGLNPDGVVGGHTLASLNAPPYWRRAQLAANLERLRWLGGQPQGRYILVDVAEARLRLFEDDALVLEMRIAVGTDENQTPSFQGRMTYLVFRPFWNIPESIAGEEIVPNVLADPDYLASHEIDLLPGWKSDAEVEAVDPASVQWSDLDPEHLPFRMRQRPGRLNPLGNVKFMFPNSFNIYLHDTSNRGIFARDGRNLSHGCVRIQKPVSLATYLLRRNEEWNVAKIEEAMSAEATSEIGLPEPIPVYLVYRTVFADSQGRIVYRNDPYERDAPLATALGYLAPAENPALEEPSERGLDQVSSSR